MHNGGSDCCGTCWFNSQNGEEHNLSDSAENSSITCTIRALEIEAPFWTYCANHPHHNPDRVKVPVGPIYHNDESYPNTRRVWVHSPDTEEIRTALVEVLETVPEIPPPEYPFGKPFVEEVIHQLTAFREKRAIPGLMRILSFDPLSQSVEKDSPFTTTRIGTVALAVEAIAIIGGAASLPGWKHFVNIGIDYADYTDDEYYAGQDKLAVIRYHAVRGLRFCEGDESMDLLKGALKDPHEEVRVFAEAMLLEKVGPRAQHQIIQEVRGKKGKTRLRFRFGRKK